jgi:hypothetical protein
MTETDHNKIPQWYAEIFPAGPSNGWFHKWKQHAASFVDRGSEQLVISFDNLSDAGYPHPNIEPWAAKFISDNGWSHLGVYARGPSWYRDAQLIEFFEKLHRDGFFARFDRVALIGTSMGGFASLVFSSFAPGATVVALSPQTTLHADLVPWETRFGKGRAQNWDLPYSDAAEHLDTVGQVYVVYDPFMQADKRHVMRLPQDRLIHLKGFGFGHKTAVVLRRIEYLKSFMYGAITGTLKPDEFYDAARARKDLYIYRLSMESYLMEQGREDRMRRFRFAFRTRRKNNAVVEKQNTPVIQDVPK